VPAGTAQEAAAKSPPTRDRDLMRKAYRESAQEPIDAAELRPGWTDATDARRLTTLAGAPDAGIRLRFPAPWRQAEEIIMSAMRQSRRELFGKLVATATPRNHRNDRFLARLETTVVRRT
jgi:hypothetical protein